VSTRFSGGDERADAAVPGGALSWSARVAAEFLPSGDQFRGIESYSVKGAMA